MKRLILLALIASLVSGTFATPSLSGAVARKWTACAVSIADTGVKVVIGVKVADGTPRAFVISGAEYTRAARLALAIVQAEINKAVNLTGAETFTLIIG